jgi:hypothetical protein
MVHPRATYFALDTLRYGGLTNFATNAKLAISPEDISKVQYGIYVLDYAMLREVVQKNYDWYLAGLKEIYKEQSSWDLIRLLKEILEGEFAKKYWLGWKSHEEWQAAWQLGPAFAGLRNTNQDQFTIRGMLRQWSAGMDGYGALNVPKRVGS